MKEGAKLSLWVVGILFVGLSVPLGLAWYGQIAGRPLAKYGEETRRQVYQESTTAQTACQANLARYYAEWSNADGEHRIALEVEARAEAGRYRCRGLDPDLQRWLEEIRR